MQQVSAEQNVLQQINDAQLQERQKAHNSSKVSEGGHQHNRIRSRDSKHSKSDCQSSSL